jgi:hypothetical protein
MLRSVPARRRALLALTTVATLVAAAPHGAGAADTPASAAEVIADALRSEPRPASAELGAAQVDDLEAAETCATDTRAGVGGGSLLRFQSATLSADCASDTLTFSFFTQQAFDPEALDYAVLGLDIDNNDSTGCEGADYGYAILGGFGDGTVDAGLVRMRSCTDAAAIGSISTFFPNGGIFVNIGSWSQFGLVDGSSVRWLAEMEDWGSFDVSRAPGTGWGTLTLPGGAAQPPAGPEPTPPSAPRIPTTDGYWILGEDGAVWAFGGYGSVGNGRSLPATANYVDIEPTPNRDSYWLLMANGTVHGFGNATALGGIPAGSLRSGETASSITSTATGGGYWVFTSAGRVFTFGDARSFGDLSTVTLNGPIVASVPTTTGNGYWMVGSDGGVFAFGDASFMGSTGSIRLNKPVNGIVPTLSGNGYWLVASDGGVFAFGDAPFLGSAGSISLNKPVIGMIAYGNGYLMVASDGGVFNYSNKAFAGSLGATPPSRPIVSIAA